MYCVWPQVGWPQEWRGRNHCGAGRVMSGTQSLVRGRCGPEPRPGAARRRGGPAALGTSLGTSIFLGGGVEGVRWNDDLLNHHRFEGFLMRFQPLSRHTRNQCIPNQASPHHNGLCLDAREGPVAITVHHLCAHWTNCSAPNHAILFRPMRRVLPSTLAKTHIAHLVGANMHFGLRVERAVAVIFRQALPRSLAALPVTPCSFRRYQSVFAPA